jgi:hypothetical protein
LPPNFKIPVFASSALAKDTVVALACSGLALAGGNTSITLDNRGVLHMDDAPTQLSTNGTPAYPARTLYQTYNASLRVMCDIDWALRTSSAIAVVESVKW